MRKPKVGILGGGQLGRMLLQVCSNYDIETFVLDHDANAPCKNLCDHFSQGSLLDEATVLEFGKDLDVITIEIENVNTAALFKLNDMGKRVIPHPEVLEVIQDKSKQNQFYTKYEIPTPLFKEINSRSELATYSDKLPLVQKLRKFGYDGKGVQVLENTTDLGIAFDEPSIVEEKVDIEKEIGVIAIRSKSGKTVMYPPTEMIFDQNLNLVDYLISPAEIPLTILKQVESIAKKTVDSFQWPGIYAIEMFLSKSGAVYVNETAPRTHNSGHSTIEGSFTSQFEQHARLLLGLEPGNTETVKMSLMWNIIGPEEVEGEPIYNGLEAVSALDKVYIHLYGKSISKPGRKLGHVTILGDSRNELLEKLSIIRSVLTITV